MNRLTTRVQRLEDVREDPRVVYLVLKGRDPEKVLADWRLENPQDNREVRLVETGICRAPGERPPEAA